MTILSAFDQASRLMGKGAQTTLINNSDPFAVEALAMLNEVATEIFERHDWNKLITLNTETGDDVTTAFDLPDDYARMPVKANIYETASNQPLTHIIDLDVWLDNRLQTFTGAVGEWTILGGQVHIFPALATGASAKFYYISNLIVDPASGANKTSFTVDTDVFRLPERLLWIGLISKWNATKGTSYAQEFENFELALAQAISRDKGSRILAVGRPRVPPGTTEAFHGTITP